MGRFQAEQPVLGKVGVRPAMVIVRLGPDRVGPSRLRRMLRRRMRTQPSSGRKTIRMAVFEVLKPAAQRPIDVGNDRVQAVA